MPIAVKKNVENNAQNAWWRIALASVQPSSAKSAVAFLARWGEPVENSRHGNINSGTSRTSAAPADMIDQNLRRRQKDQHAGAGRGIDHGHRCRQSRAEPAAEQDGIRNIADERDADTDAQAEAQLELPEMVRVRGEQERSAEQKQAERIDAAGSGIIEQPADQRRRQPARQRGQRVN